MSYTGVFRGQLGRAQFLPTRFAVNLLEVYMLWRFEMFNATCTVYLAWYNLIMMTSVFRVAVSARSWIHSVPVLYGHGRARAMCQDDFLRMRW